MKMRFAMIRSLPLWLPLLAGCAKPTLWEFDSIAAGDKSYDSARLLYQDPESGSHLRLEFLRIGTGVDLFLNLTQYTISPSPLDPSSTLVPLKIGEAPPIEERAHLLEGRMRLRFEPETASLITRALQEGKRVGILIDGFEETIEPERFGQFYEKLTGSASFFQNLIKGPM